MSLIVNGTNILDVQVNGSPVDKVISQGETVWRRMRSWATTATSTTPLNSIAEYRIDFGGAREPYVDADQLFGSSVNSILDGENLAIVLVSYGECCSTGMALRHNGVYIPARAYNFGNPSYDSTKDFWTVGKINELNTSLCSRSFHNYGMITYHGLEQKTSSTATSHVLDKWGNSGRHYNWSYPGGCSDPGKGGWSAYIIHGDSFSYLLNRLGLRNTPNVIRSN